jgi:hypothetical protein
MKYLVLAAICVITISVSLTAETLYRPDSSRIEFTMGCVTSCGSFINCQTGTYLTIQCPPILFKEDSLIDYDERYYGADWKSFGSDQTPLPYFIKFKPEFLKKYITDNIGDTIMVIYEDGSFLATINEIGWANGNTYDELMCHASPIGQIPLPTKCGYYNVICVRNMKIYSGPIIKFWPFQITDSLSMPLLDSLKNIVAQSWVDTTAKYNPYYDNSKMQDIFSDPNRRVAACYRNITKSNQDIRFWAVYLNDDAATWKLGLFRMEYMKGIPIVKTYIPDINGSVEFQIQFAIDLNNNSNLEYIVEDYTDESSLPEYYEDLGVEWRWIACGCGSVF